MKSTPIRIEGKEKAVLSAAQKKFNSLLKKIEKSRKILKEWDDARQQFISFRAQEYTPLSEALQKKQEEMIVFLDSCYETYKLTPKQKEKLSYIILDLCQALPLDGAYAHLKVIFDRHDERGFDALYEEEKASTEEMLKSKLASQFGINLDDLEIDINNPQDFAQKVQDRISQQQAENPRKQTRKSKTHKQIEKEALQQKEEQAISKSIQSVYRQLVTALHPDREPDPIERERKTELMKQVTVAYDKKDLLKLLELQLALEQIDQEHLGNIAEDKLKHFNKLLQEQANQLADEIRMHCYNAGAELHCYFPIPNPQYFLMEYKKFLAGLKSTIQIMNEDMASFQSPKALKAWIKDYYLPEEDNFPFGPIPF